MSNHSFLIYMLFTSVCFFLFFFLDIFRNPDSLFCYFEPPKEKGTSPFDLVLTHSGEDFAVMGMHFKLGLYEHQSAGAIQGLMDLLCQHPSILKAEDTIRSIVIKAYQPAFGIIGMPFYRIEKKFDIPFLGDPAKRHPTTRQSADHSVYLPPSYFHFWIFMIFLRKMVYIIATLLRKAIESKFVGSGEAAWCELMLTPHDYSKEAISNPHTQALMDKIIFVHGGKEYDDKYPEGKCIAQHTPHSITQHTTQHTLRYPYFRFDCVHKWRHV